MEQLSTASPTTPTKTPISVIPIWTVERNRLGVSIRRRAVFALGTPSLMRCCKRALREEGNRQLGQNENGLHKYDRQDDNDFCNYVHRKDSFAIFQAAR